MRGGPQDFFECTWRNILGISLPLGAWCFEMIYLFNAKFHSVPVRHEALRGRIGRDPFFFRTSSTGTTVHQVVAL